LSASLDISLVLFLWEGAAHSVGARWIYSRVALFDVADDTFLVHDECSARGKALFFTVDAVGFGNCALEIAEEGEGYADLFGEGAIGGEAVNTDAKNLRFGCVEFGDISLIRL
jgi:hypothetical protein